MPTRIRLAVPELNAPADHIIACIIAVLVSPGFPSVLPLVHRFGKRALLRGIIATSILTAASIAYFSAREPFDDMHQKRLFIIHMENVTTSEQHLHLAAADGAPGFELLVNDIVREFGTSDHAPAPVGMNDHNSDWDSLYPFSASFGGPSSLGQEGGGPASVPTFPASPPTQQAYAYEYPPRPQMQGSNAAASPRADRPDRLSFAFSSFQPPASESVTLGPAPELPNAGATEVNLDFPLRPIQEDVERQDHVNPLDHGPQQAPSPHEEFEPYAPTLVPPRPVPYFVGSPQNNAAADLPEANPQPANKPMIYDTGSGFGTAPDLDEESYAQGQDSSTEAERSWGDRLLSFVAFVVIVLFLPIILPYKLIRQCFGSRASYHQIPDSSKPSRLDAALRHVNHVPKMAYQHFLLLRLPNLYFSRVARIFEEADLSLGDLKTMALESAEKNLSSKGGVSRNSPVWHWEHGGARGGCLPPAYESLRATWDEFVGNLLREWKTFNLISVLLLSAILTILQIDAASEDPYSRYFALSSLICALISLLYGCVYIIRFGTMRKPYKAAEWALEAKKSKVFYWNVWVLLAMPAVYLAWSLLLFVCCIMSFVWRTGIPEPEPDPNAEAKKSDPVAMHMILRTIVSFILALGLIYGALIVSTFQRYGTRMDKAWMKRIDGWVQEKKRVKQQIDLEIEREREMVEREADNREWNEDEYVNVQRPQLQRGSTGATRGTRASSVPVPPPPPPPPPFIPIEAPEEGPRQEEMERGIVPLANAKSKSEEPTRRHVTNPGPVPMEKLPSYRESDDFNVGEGSLGQNPIDSDAEEDEYGDSGGGGGGVLDIIAASGFGAIDSRRERSEDSPRGKASAGLESGSTIRVANPPIPVSVHESTRAQSLVVSMVTNISVSSRKKRSGKSSHATFPLNLSTEDARKANSAAVTLEVNPRGVQQISGNFGGECSARPPCATPSASASSITSPLQDPPLPQPSAALIRPPPPPPPPLPPKPTINIDSTRSDTSRSIRGTVNLVPPSPIRSPFHASSEDLTDSPVAFNSETPLIRTPKSAESSSSNLSLIRNEGLRNVLGANDLSMSRKSPSPSHHSPRSPGSASWDGGGRSGGTTSFESPGLSSGSLLLSPASPFRPGHSKSMSAQEHVRRPPASVEGTSSRENLAPQGSASDDEEARLNKALDEVLQRKKGGSVRSGGA
ncbi:hypothetical protein NMY22_g4892 [Coprinellus aureogranulatus]|nr:hypothetical protein NMY22_g4892 [Coprinellus aureogranulatus]